VDPDRDHWRGGEGVAVTLVEYGDYECPFSRMAFRVIQRLESQLGGQLRFVFRHLPLIRIHPHARGRPSGRGGRALGPFLAPA
jgi:protein-disulfide isomerase